MGPKNFRVVEPIKYGDGNRLEPGDVRRDWPDEAQAARWHKAGFIHDLDGALPAQPIVRGPVTVSPESAAAAVTGGSDSD